MLVNTEDHNNGVALIGFRQPATNAIPRTVHDKLAERVSVLDFGAHGNGKHDNRDAISKAVSYVAVNGGELVFSPGHYLIKLSDNLTIPKYTRKPRTD